MAEKLSNTFWNDRYQTNEIGWDMGEISPPLKAYIDQLANKDLKILIPGAGNSYEAAYLFKNGFTAVHILDFAEKPMLDFLKRNPEFPLENVHVGDFFEHEGSYDLILEQTLFCALDPSLRRSYAIKVAELLLPKGKLVGLLFNKLFDSGPPFGGTKEEYLNYFVPDFESVEMNECYNSYPPRQGSELFIQLVR
ncbi:MAG: hypothetical protein ACI837_001907 [Crocinitomicaceae bacterium]|jgi:hypothetical protein